MCGDDVFGAISHLDAEMGLEAAESFDERLAADDPLARNAPFAGAYVTQHYGRPSKGQHAMQIEINRALYMDEAKIEPTADFLPLRRLLRGVIAEIAAIGTEDSALAAE